MTRGSVSTALHSERFASVATRLDAAGARSVLDLGCGTGEFLCALAQTPGITRLTGVEHSPEALRACRMRLADVGPAVTADVRLIAASLFSPGPDAAGHDAAIMIEVIEHLDPGQLSVLERLLFRTLAPADVILTTPNADMNALLGVRAGRMRHPGHRFEWGRARFRTWTTGAAARGGYACVVTDIAGHHPDLGGASQMAHFSRGGGASRAAIS